MLTSFGANKIHHMLDACIGFLGLGKLLYSTTGVAIANLQETKDRQQDRQAQAGDQKKNRGTSWS